MACHWIQLADGTVAHLNISRRVRRCACGNPHTFLCDFPVSKNRIGKIKTCDKPLCQHCTNKGQSPDVDFCADHFPLAKAAYERRQLRKEER